MSRVYKYNLRSPATLTGTTSATSGAAKCKGARMVILRYKSTDAVNTLASIGFNVGNDVANLMFAGAGQSSTVTLQQGPVANNRLDRAGGIFAIVVPADVRTRIPWEFVQATATANAGDVAGLSIEAEVYFDDDVQDMSNTVLPGF